MNRIWINYSFVSKYECNACKFCKNTKLFSFIYLFFCSITIPEKLEYFINKYAEHSHDKWSMDKVKITSAVFSSTVNDWVLLKYTQFCQIALCMCIVYISVCAFLFIYMYVRCGHRLTSLIVLPYFISFETGSSVTLELAILSRLIFNARVHHHVTFVLTKPHPQPQLSLLKIYLHWSLLTFTYKLFMFLLS